MTAWSDCLSGHVTCLLGSFRCCAREIRQAFFPSLKLDTFIDYDRVLIYHQLNPHPIHAANQKIAKAEATRLVQYGEHAHDESTNISRRSQQYFGNALH